MWVCPKCGREFKRKNQGHYCGEAPKTVAAYIDAQPVEAQPHLTALAALIRDSVPGVRERIAWSMPTYEQAGGSLSFAACKDHVSLYVGSEALEKFAAELCGFSTKKSALYLPYSQTLPEDLLRELIKSCFAQAGSSGGADEHVG